MIETYDYMLIILNKYEQRKKIIKSKFICIYDVSEPLETFDKLFGIDNVRRTKYLDKYFIKIEV